MIGFIVGALAGVPPVIATLVLAMMPVGELRGALPVALLVYQLPVVLAVALSILGNMIPIFFVLEYIDDVVSWLSSRSPLAKRFFEWLFERTRRKLTDRVEKYGYWALALFVAVPLPVTGAWTNLRQRNGSRVRPIVLPIYRLGSHC